MKTLAAFALALLPVVSLADVTVPDNPPAATGSATQAAAVPAQPQPAPKPRRTSYIVFFSLGVIIIALAAARRRRAQRP